jgi:hypothetical protein
MCSACSRGTHALAMVPSADQVPVKSTRLGASSPDVKEMFPVFSGIFPDDMIGLKRGTTSGNLFACQIGFRLLPLLCRDDSSRLEPGPLLRQARGV